MGRGATQRRKSGERGEIWRYCLFIELSRGLSLISRASALGCQEWLRVFGRQVDEGGIRHTIGLIK